MLNIEQQEHYQISLHHLGFRPFFLLAGLFAVVSVAIWALQYHFNLLPPHISRLPVIYWHGHEMIFGYGMAVIAGFLLTAVRNWTNRPTLHGWLLMTLALFWLLARLAPFTDPTMSMDMDMMLFFDMGFDLLLWLAILRPILQAQQWQQFGILLILAMLTLSNLAFYFGMYEQLRNGMQIGLYAGLYLIIAMILLMGRRVIPFFIEKGVDEPVTLTNYRWLDVSNAFLVPIFIFLQLFGDKPGWASLLALALFLLHSLRLAGWHTPGIWRKPLLWILYIAYGAVTLGFGMTALADFGYVSPMLAGHMFGFGGIGLMTLGMMARVALGHTGRDVFKPPAVLRWIFLLAILGLCARVGLPLVLPALYRWWIGLAQVLWIASFGLFSWVYTPILIKPRVDGRYG